MTKLEEVARALAKHYGFDDWDDEECPQENLKQAAQAMILAIREPTEEMSRAATLLRRGAPTIGRAGHGAP